VKIGVDVVEVERMRAMLQRWGPRAVARLFLPQEARWCASKADPAVHFAGRVAAKEAVRKAVGAIHWTDVEISATEDGAPHVVVHNPDLARRIRENGWERIEVSISHTDRVAVAVALVVPASSRWL
jgi:holo-[acyl-carrier protein] synthase